MQGNTYTDKHEKGLYSGVPRSGVGESEGGFRVEFKLWTVFKTLEGLRMDGRQGIGKNGNGLGVPYQDVL